MIVLSALNREPVTVPLRPPYAPAQVTLRRLTSNAFEEASAATQALLRDQGRVALLIEHHDLRDGRKLKALLTDPDFVLGLSGWITAVECGVRAIIAWSGFCDAERRPLPVTREALEVLMLVEPLRDQLMREIQLAAQLVRFEGNVSGASPNGSAGPAPTASAPSSATTVAGAQSPAPGACHAATAPHARRSSSRRSRTKAPPSGGSAPS